MDKYPVESFQIEIEQFKQACGEASWIEPGLSLSKKTSWRNQFGVDEALLLISQVGWSETRIPNPENWACVRLEALKGLIGLPRFDPDQLQAALSDSRAFSDSPLPVPNAILHASIDLKYACFSELLPILAASCILDSIKILHGWFKEFALVLPFDPDLRRLCQDISSAGQVNDAFVLPNRGLLVGGGTPTDCCEKLNRLVKTARDQLPISETAESEQQAPLLGTSVLPGIRSQISAQRGRPLVMHVDGSMETRQFIDSPVSETIVQTGPPIPAFFACTGLPVLWPGENQGIASFPIESASGASLMLKSGLGVIVAADTVHEAKAAADYFHRCASLISSTKQLGGFYPLDLEDLSIATQWITPVRPVLLPFSGEIALVTGAASGIGKAIVGSLLRRGSTVIGVDVNPAIAETFQSPGYNGKICNVADEDMVRQTFQIIANEFGGLDMLVLNAGLFPGGSHIEKQSLDEFTNVLNVNFVSNLVIMREAIPLLRLAPRYGRVVVVGSKNLRAPGLGAAAYSTSKAALTQLARVAALEWAGDRVRVNVIHPDAVFDTALFTEEVLQARAAHYGMSVEQYKKRNLLKTEITSHDVAELVAEMCGPLFRHVTGAQIQIDGGNDRTI